MAQKRNTRLAGAVSSLAQKLGIKGVEEKTPEAVIGENRRMNMEIISCLKSIDFRRCAYRGTSDADSVEVLQKKTAAMVKILETANSVTDDISRINELLLYAARAFKAAVTDGDYNKAVWAKNALSEGILYLRDNVPDTDAEMRSHVINARAEYLQNYRRIIQLYEKVDHQKKTLEDFESRLSQLHAEYDPAKQRIKNINSTDEGRMMYGNLKLHENEPALLSDKEQDFLAFIRMTALQAHSIYVADANRLATRLQYEQSLSQAEDVRISLIKRPDVYNEKLTAEHAALLQEQVEEIARTIEEYAAYTDNLKAADAALKNLLKSAEARGLVTDTLRKSEMKEEENLLQDEAVRAGEEMARKADAADALKTRAREELEKAPEEETAREEEELLMPFNS